MSDRDYNKKWAVSIRLSSTMGTLFGKPEKRTLLNCTKLSVGFFVKNRQLRTAYGYCSFCHACERDAKEGLQNKDAVQMRGIDGVIIILRFAKKTINNGLMYPNPENNRTVLYLGQMKLRFQRGACYLHPRQNQHQMNRYISKFLEKMYSYT